MGKCYKCGNMLINQIEEGRWYCEVCDEYWTWDEHKSFEQWTWEQIQRIETELGI
jgi:uncharacterized Zn finger protein (UPF0148 family)